MTSEFNSGMSCTRFKLREISYSWRLENFSLCNEKCGEFIDSEIFPKLDGDKCEWRLFIYPRGRTTETDNYVSVNLEFLEEEQTKTTANFILSVQNSNREILKSEKYESFVFGELVSHTENHKFIKRDELLCFLKDDVLVIDCNLKWSAYDTNVLNMEMSSIKNNVHMNLSNDLRQLVNKQKSFSDIRLLANDGTIFSAHKCILAARSPVFAAMFEHVMKEKQESTVKIQDVSSNILKALLEFIYGSQFDNEKCQLEELLAAADKYDVKDLRSLCEEELVKKITVKNATELLMLADRHNSMFLKERLLEFMTTNLKYLIETEGMKNLSSSHPTLHYDILKFVSHKLCK